MTSAVNQLAARLIRLERQVRTMGTAPQLAYSSIEDGAIEEYTIDDSLVQIIGAQFDGTHMAAPINGPNPPVPTEPIVTDGVDGALVRWDGEWITALFAPMDFARIEIHASTDAGDTFETALTLRNSFESPRGGEVFIPLDTAGPWYIAFVARSLSGQVSEPSGVTETNPTMLSDVLAGVGGTTTYRQASAPGTANEGDFWLDSDDGNSLHRYESGVWVDVQDADITAAINAAATAQSTADGKVRIFAQASAPGGMTAGDVGDMWIETDADNRVWVWDGDSWEDRRVGSAGIVSLAVDKLITGTLSAIITLSGTIKTAASGSRVEQDADGIRLYNSSDDVTVNLDTTTGLATLTGGFRSAIDGTRVEIGTGSDFFGGPQEARFYTGHVLEADPGEIECFIDPTDGGIPFLYITSPSFRGLGAHGSGIYLQDTSGDNTNPAAVSIVSDFVHLIGVVSAHDGVLSSTMETLEVMGSTSTVSSASTTFVALGSGGSAGLAFTAPPSGKVLIIHDTTIHNGTASNSAVSSFEVRTGDTIGSGTVVLAASDDRAVFNFDSLRVSASVARLVEGLTPGNAYNVRTLVRCGAGTVQVSRAHLTLVPST